MRCILHVSWTRFLIGLSWQRVTLVRQDGPTRPLCEVRLWTLDVALGPILVHLAQKPAPEPGSVNAPVFPYNGPIQRR